MTDKWKVLEKVRQGQKNVRLNLLRKLMRLWGFDIRETKEGVQYTHPKLPFPISVVKHREKGQENKILQPYVKKCLKAIYEIKDEEEKNEG